MFDFPQDSIRCLELSNDVTVKQTAAEQSDVEYSGTLVQLFRIELIRNVLHEILK